MDLYEMLYGERESDDTSVVDDFYDGEQAQDLTDLFDERDRIARKSRGATWYVEWGDGD